MSRLSAAFAKGRPALVTFVTAGDGDTAAILGNTPRICERCYVDPRVFEGWEDGRLQRVAANARGPRQWEQAATRFLKRTRRGS